jgi:alpha-beta hydrolase superfamily lysophospholipase
MNDNSHSVANPSVSIHHAAYSCPLDHEGTSVAIRGWYGPELHTLPIILLHDVGESTGDLDPFAEALAARGYKVYSFDLSGLSTYERGATRAGLSLHRLSLDLLQVVAWIKHKSQGERPLIIAQGLGALVALYFARNFQKYCRGCVLVSPTLNPGDTIRPLQRFIIRLLAELIPAWQLPVQFCPAFNYYFSQNGRMLKKQRTMSVRLANEVLMVMAQFKKLLHRLKLPTLLICPDEDQLYKYEGVKRAIAKHPQKHLASLQFIETREHDLLTCGDTYNAQIIARIDQWLAELPAAKVEPEEGTV